MEMLLLDALIAMSSVFVAVVEILIALRFMTNFESWLRTAMFICGIVIGGAAIIFFAIKMLVVYRYCSPPMGIIQLVTMASIAENVIFGIVLYRFSSGKKANRCKNRGRDSLDGPIPTPVN